MKHAVTNTEFEAARNNPENQRIIKAVCSKYARQLSQETLKQCGDCAIWECLKVHDERLQKFTSSLYRYVNWNCLRELNTSKYVEINSIDFTEYIYDTHVEQSSLDSYLINLTPIEAHIIRLKFEKNYTLKDIMELTGYSRPKISQIIAAALAKIRATCNKFGV